MKTTFKTIKNSIKRATIAGLAIVMVGTAAVPAQAAIMKEEYEYTTPGNPYNGSLGNLVKVTKTFSTKQDVKKVKMRKPSKKTYTKSLPDKKTSSISREQPEEWLTVETICAVTYHTTESYKKGSKIKTVKTIKETVVTKTVTEEPYVCCPPIPEEKVYEISVLEAAPKMDYRVVRAFEKFGCKIVVNPYVSSDDFGFDYRTKTITLPTNPADNELDRDNRVYRELGMFVSVAINGTDRIKFPERFATYFLYPEALTDAERLSVEEHIIMLDVCINGNGDTAEVFHD